MCPKKCDFQKTRCYGATAGGHDCPNNLPQHPAKRFRFASMVRSFFRSSILRTFQNGLLKQCFFLVLGPTLEGLLDRYGHHFGPQKASEKSGCQKKLKTAQREKRNPNLSIPVGSARKRLRISHVLSTMMALLKNSRAGGSGFKFR